MKKGFLILFVFLTIIVRSQTPDDVSDIYSNTHTNKSLNLFNPINNINPYEYNYCDIDGDGYVNINIEEITQTIISDLILINVEEEAIFISTYSGNIIRIDQPSTQPNIQYLCNTPWLLSDIAIDKQKNIFVNNDTSIYSLDSQNCIQDSVYEHPVNNFMNSLSFDTEGNLYFGFGASPEIYRFDAYETTNPYIWHDFGIGRAGGDFVMLNGMLYISWSIEGSFKLYKVTVDENFNYLSHQDLGFLLNNTFGLASEFGKLFGVTPTTLYHINLGDLTLTTIYENDGVYGNWWGAAGLHEDINIIGTAYETLEDATNEINPLPNNFINTQFGKQIIYIRIENSGSDEVSIIEVQINIYNTPQINTPNNLQFCTINESLSVFNLREVEDELLVNNNQNVIISYYKNYEDALNSTNEISAIYQSISQQENIYVKVKNIDNPCFSIDNFFIINEFTVNLAPIINEPSLRTLNNCYLNSLEQGYFDLNEIYEEIILDSYDDYYLRFYRSFSDAEQEFNEISHIYFSSIGQIDEIYVNVYSDGNCINISNFFINGNCVFETNDISNIYFPKVFTPNEDSFNDRWAIKGVSRELRKETIVHIYNRYGKLLYAYRPYKENGWDGTFHGKLMPSNDYWFKVIIPNSKAFTGHFTLKR